MEPIVQLSLDLTSIEEGLHVWWQPPVGIEPDREPAETVEKPLLNVAGHQELDEPRGFPRIRSASRNGQNITTQNVGLAVRPAPT